MLTDTPTRRVYSFHDLQRCAMRETRHRRRFYPNRVLTHRMTQWKADVEINMMAAIADHFAELAAKERLL